MKRRDLTRGDISHVIWHLSIPLILSNVFNTIFEITDAVFIGKLGSAALAGVSIAGTVLFFLSTFAVGLGVGTVALVARYTGAKDYHKANETAVQSFFVGFVFSLLLGAIGYILSPSIMIILGGTGEMFNHGISYIRTLFLGIFTMFFMFQGSAVLRGSGDTKTPMKISIFANLLNVFLDWVLIFGKFGFPAMGAQGAALATVISRGIGGFIIFILLLRGRHNIHLNFKEIDVNFDLMKKIIKIGIPTSIQMFIRSSSSIILIKIVALFGQATIAAYGIGARYFTLFLLPGFGFADASATLVGQNLGSGQPDRARQSALLSSFYYFLMLIGLSTLTFVFSKEIVMLFNSEREVVRIGMVWLRYMSIGALFLSFALVLSRSFQGAGDSLTPMFITVFALYFFQIPVAYILAIMLKWGITGIWISQPLAGALQAILTIWLFLQGKWIHKKI